MSRRSLRTSCDESSDVTPTATTSHVTRTSHVMSTDVRSDVTQRTSSVVSSLSTGADINSCVTTGNDLVNDDPLSADPVSSRPPSVRPNTQRNSSEFTFAKSVSTSTCRPASTSATSRNAPPTHVKASAANIKDSLPEFSVDLDLTKSPLCLESGSRDGVTSSADFYTLVVGQTQCLDDDRDAGRRHVTSDVTSSASALSSSCLEPLLGEERVQRLMRNLRDIDHVTTPRHGRLDHHDLSRATDTCQSNTDTRWASTSSALYETRSSGLRETRLSVGRTRSEVLEARISGVLERVSSNLRRGSGLHERTRSGRDSEDEDDVKMRSSAVERDDLSVSRSSRAPGHNDVISKQSAHDAGKTPHHSSAATDSSTVEYSYKTRDTDRLDVVESHSGRGSDTERHVDIDESRLSDVNHSSRTTQPQTSTVTDRDDDDDDGDDDRQLRQSTSCVQQHVDSIADVLPHR